MTTQPFQDQPSHPQVNAQKLWAGGAASAVVAALVALVGILVFRGLFDVPVLAPESNGVWGGAGTVQLMVGAAVCALLATALIHLLLISTPRAQMFFSWTVGLLTVAAALAPFATDANLDSKVATAILNLVIGLAILSLVSGVARTAVVRAPYRARPVRPQPGTGL
jgi:uncharacterized protein YhhL (DUF1145 family)